MNSLILMNFIGACPTQPEQSTDLPIISLTLDLLAFLAILYRQPLLASIRSDDPWACPSKLKQSFSFRRLTFKRLSAFTNLPITSLSIVLLALHAILYRQPMRTSIRSDDLTPRVCHTKPEQSSQLISIQ